MSASPDLLVQDAFCDARTCRALIAAQKTGAPVLQSHTSNPVYLHPLRTTAPAKFVLAHAVIHRVIALIAAQFHLHVGCDLALVSAITGRYTHPVHADNTKLVCPTHGDNQAQLVALHCQCPAAQLQPNHTPWRSHTAMLYLDNAHTGGSIIFGEGPGRYGGHYRTEIAAQQGRLVLSPSTADYYHHTTPVTQGVRYALNLWFTPVRQYQWRDWD